MKALSDADLALLEEACNVAAGKEWMIGCTPPDWTKEQVAAYAAENIRLSNGGPLWMVGYGGTYHEATNEVDELQIVALTGNNGPTSEAFARYFVALQPANMLLLLAELRALRAAAPWAAVIKGGKP